MRHVLLVVILPLAACEDEVYDPAVAVAQEPASAPATREEAAAELIVARSGCARCHAIAADEAKWLLPLAGPELRDAARWRARDGGAAFLRQHHGGDDAGDLAAWLLDLGAKQPPLAPAATNETSIRRGGELFAELACGACHAPDLLAGLAARTDHDHVASFLLDPATHRPGVVHDFGLTHGEADAMAAWLLRMQFRDDDAPPMPGFAYECYELQIDKNMPKLDGLEPKANGLVDVIGVEPRTRQNHFALRFEATIEVPAKGEWTFTAGSDDSSWLWIDDQLVVDNAGMKPHTRRQSSIRLDAGPHALRVLYTQGGGDKSLEVLWRGPGVDEQPIPASAASAKTVVLSPPEALRAADSAAVQRGRAAAVQRRCTACHTVDDAQLATLPAPPAAKAWRELDDAPCPADVRGRGIFGIARQALTRPHDAAARLQFALMRDACLSCHTRDGVGGLPVAVSKHLVEVEDLGEEGRMPPDLTAVGRRLQRDWIEKVLAEGHKVRNYVRVRMPRVAKAEAKRYADWFATVDAGPDEDVEPRFSAAAVELGHKLAGVSGKNCISCHTFGGQPSTGADGMDLTIQNDRLRPAWFRQWLLRAPVVRPGTRMPLFWPASSADDIREVDAIRSWLSLGAAAPLPEGLVPAKGSLVLLPTARPVLHGAFLRGLSARCIAVGCKERTHFAFDVEHGRLAWLWRGDFLDATGTWHGRAGQLLQPLGQDWIVLDDFVVGGEKNRTVTGHRISPDGYPIFGLRIGDAEFEDGARARLSDTGTVIVRTLRGTKGAVEIEWQSQDGVTILVDGQPAPATSTLRAGTELEVVYRW